MRKAILSFVALTAVLLVAGSGFAAFTSTANSQDNQFRAGTLNLQLSNTGTGGWSNLVNRSWQTPINWAPGDTYEDVVYLRNQGTVDADSVLVDMSGINAISGPAGFENQIQLISAWYDSNGNGIRDGGEGILSDIMAVADATAGNNDGVATLGEIYGYLSVPAQSFELEAGASNVLPGSSAAVKGLYLEWEFLDLPNNNLYQGAVLEIDLDFTASNIE